MTIRSRIFCLAMMMLVAIPAAAQQPAPAPAENTLDPLRERFREGMEKYKAGQFDDALKIWKAIYAELGAEKGYRLAFNLARAHEQRAAANPGTPQALADATEAVKHFAHYVDETTRRRSAGETLEPLVEKQEAEAKERLGRIELRGGDDGLRVKVDEVERKPNTTLWVTPGRHFVVFTDQSPIVVDVNVGESKVVEAPEPKSSPALTMPKAKYETKVETPFHKGILYAGVAATAAAAVIPALLYDAAIEIQDDYSNPNTTAAQQRQLQEQYNGARSAAYASLSVPIVAAAATVGLFMYWFLGTKEHQVRVGKTSHVPSRP